MYQNKKRGGNENKKTAITAAPGTVSRAATELQDNRPQSVMQKKKAGAVSGRQDSGTIIQQKTNKTSLPDNLKSGIENLSGHSMDDVKVHYNSDKPAQLNAHAYAQGTEIHLAPGQEKHLPHEAWHVVQQKQRRVKPTMQMKGKVNVNDDKGLEKEADVMGAKEIVQMVNNGKFRNITGNSGYITLAVDQKNMGHTYIILESKEGAWMYHFRADSRNAFSSLVKMVTWFGSFEEIRKNPVNKKGKTPQEFVKGRGMNFHELKVKKSKVDKVKALCQGAVGGGTFSLILSNIGIGNNCFSKVYNILKTAGFAFSWSSYLLSFVSPRLALSQGAGFHEVNEQKHSKYSYQ